jgi:hypothetical protein
MINILLWAMLILGCAVLFAIMVVITFVSVIIGDRKEYDL